MNIYDQILALPPTHRLALAAWAMATIQATDKQIRAAMVEGRRIASKRPIKEDNNSMKVSQP